MTVPRLVPRVAIIGGTGFLGKNLQAELPKEWEVTFLCHVAKPVSPWKSYEANITDRESLASAFQGKDAVMHLVGIIREKPPEVTFKKIHTDGTRNVIEAATRAGVKKIIYVSALGASLEGRTEYFRTKAEAEELVKKSSLRYTIFRPSVIFGPGAGFTNQLLKTQRFAPFWPVPGGGNFLFQPISAKNVSQCLVQAVTDPQTDGKIFNLVGPERLKLREIIVFLREKAGSKKPIISVPLSIVRLMAKLKFQITEDELTMMEQGNFADPGYTTRVFQIPWTPFRNPDYPVF